MHFVTLESCIDLLEFVFKWVASKSEQLLKGGVVFSDFESLRSVGLQFITEKTE